jgi:hypothetical protein
MAIGKHREPIFAPRSPGALDRIGPKVVMPSVSRKTGKAKQRIDKAPAEPSEI